MIGATPVITACILARNEERRIEPALHSLQGWTDQVLVLDDGSTDRTAEIARAHGAHVIPTHRRHSPDGTTASPTGDPPTGSPPPNLQPSTFNLQPEKGAYFDALRNLAVEHAEGDWIFYLDADERVPPRLGPVLRQVLAEQGDEFEALIIPFKNFFCGKWMEHSGWWPGYCRPQLLKKGRFRYNERLHSGVQVDGRTAFFPADDPELAIDHESYDDLHHYLEKLNRYTDGEAESLVQDGGSHSWQAQLAHFIHDWQVYYEKGRADLDGMHGFILAFMSAFYRFAARAKAWDLRRQRGLLTGNQASEPGNVLSPQDCGARGAPSHFPQPWGTEGAPSSTPQSWGAGEAPESLPANLREMLEFMAQVTQTGATPWLEERFVPPSTTPTPPHAHTPTLPLVWRGPLHDPSGYADEGRQFVLGLIEAGEEVALVPERWGGEDPGLPAEVREQLAGRTVEQDQPAELCVYHTLPALQQPSPAARCNIARTMFETDRLPGPWVEQLNRMDRIWVPTEFNRETFVRSGIDPDKLAVIPGALDAERFASCQDPLPLWDLSPSTPSSPSTAANPTFTFLSVFDWTLHKGWDVLLEAFVREFGSEPQIGLLIKTWSSHHYTREDIRDQADSLLRERLGRPLSDFPNIRFLWETLPTADLPRLYRAVDAFVLPTRGEGWCRPLMEAMAAGLPTIATAWSGLTAFHSEKVGYPLPYRLVPVSETGAREIPTYRGHCWAEPDREALQKLLRQLASRPEAARRKGKAAQAHVRKHYSRAAVLPLLQAELTHCRHLAATKPQPQGPPRSHGNSPTGASHPSSVPSTQDLTPNSRSAGQPLSAISSPSSPCSPCLRGEIPFKPVAHPLPADPAEPVDFRSVLGRPLRVRWEGDQSILSSLALVNRELCLGLLAAGDVELTLSERMDPWHSLTEQDDPRFAALFALRDRPLSSPPDVTIRHHFPPNWTRPEAGRLVVIQPWEYAHLPQEWIAGAVQADEVWAYSRAVRDIYVRSGVPAEKVRVVPLGFNPAVFTPEGPAFPLATVKSTQFLFVGGALDRKGADLLLQAYLRAFTPEDPVCLVVKDMGTRTFYQGQTFGHAFRQVAADPRAPEIHYLDDDLSEAELASLYRACTCLVMPYRGEGFALPPLEAMACGVVPIVTAGGPTDDYLDDETALRVPYRRRSSGTGNNVGPFRCAGEPWQLEPDLDALVAALRWVHEHPEEARARGEAARRHVQEAWTWKRAAGHARERLLHVVAPPPPPTPQAVRPWTNGAAAEPNGTTPVPATADGAARSLIVRPLTPPARFQPVRPSKAPVASPEEGKGLKIATAEHALPSPHPPSVPSVQDLNPSSRSDEQSLSECSSPLPSSPRSPRLRGEIPPATHQQPSVPSTQDLTPEFRKEGQPLSGNPSPSSPCSPCLRGETRPELSLCMIARDEEARIGECLRSIAPYVDEMILVDTGSRDRTREIARECGARVFEFPWVDDFAAARNASLEPARGEWIFWMDADDVITPECGRQLRELCRRHPGKDAAFQVQVRIPPGPGEFSASVVDHVKLFPNRPDLRFEHRIHEQILPAIRGAGLEVLFSDVYVTHQNYDRSDAGQAKKRRRDYRLLELDLRDRPEHPFVLFNLGMTYLHATKEFEVAAHYLRRCLDRSHPADSIVRKAYAMLTTARTCQGDWAAAIRANEEGRSHYPDDAELLYQAGQLYQQVGDFPNGRLCLERLVEGAEDPHYRSVDEGLRTYRCRHELALLYRRMGDPHHCARVLRDIAHTNPDYLPAQVDLAETLLSLDKEDEGRRILDRLPEVRGIAEDVRRLRARLGNGNGVHQPADRAADAGDPSVFRFQGREYRYLVHSYNSGRERAVEVPLALALLQGCSGRVLEVGNVLSHYGVRGHTVVDRYEAAPGVLNQDIEVYVPDAPFDRIVSLSTLEHVGWDGPEERDPEKVLRVLRRLRAELLAPGGRLLATVPLGHNPHLDRLVREGGTGTGVAYLRRRNPENEWEEISEAEVGEPRYDHPYPGGNVVAVLTL